MMKSSLNPLRLKDRWIGIGIIEITRFGEVVPHTHTHNERDEGGERLVIKKIE